MNTYIKNSIKLLLILTLCLFASSLFAQKKVRIFEHKVQAKETLYGLAKRYHTDIESIKRLNPWLKIDGLKIGDKLLIRLDSNSPQKVERTKATNDTHIVEKGETLYGISRTYGITIDELLAANPQISRARFVIGAKLKIPKAKPITLPADKTKTVAPDTISPLIPQIILDKIRDFEDERYVDVLLMLPFEKSSYYVEFYEGLLMAVNDLKKQGISIRLTAEIANDEKDLKRLIKSDILEDKELIIAGTTKDEIRLLNRANKNKKTFILSPFVSATDISLRRHNFIEIHQDLQDLEEASVHHFVQEFQDMPIVFLNNGTDDESNFVTRLKKKLRREHIKFTERHITAGNKIVELSNTVFVPVTADKKTAEDVFSVLPPTIPYRVFAYPQWQSYGSEFEKLMFQHNTTIYSSFYLNLQMPEIRDFLIKYHAWFDKKIGANYPKYSLLAYDISRYFIRAYALHRDTFPEFSYSLPYDGLQMDIQLEDKGAYYRNKRFYWITFSPDRQIYRKSLQYELE